MEPVISFRDVYKMYGSQCALRGVTGQLYAGEIVGLLGVNGAGKTTLSAVLAGLHPASSGDILFRGTSIYLDVSAYRMQVGYCAQKVYEIADLTVYEQLWHAGRCFGLEEQRIIERIACVVDWCSLESVLRRYVSQLSGGYKQRFNIARSLLHDPQLIILDEPTVALDPQVRRSVWELIKTMRDGGKTVVLTTHYLDEAEYLADRVCFLEKGCIRMFDTPECLLKLCAKGKLEDIMLTMGEEVV